MEFLREFRKVRNVLLGVYDFDSRISVLPKVPLDKNTMQIDRFCPDTSCSAGTACL
jgi:hypothetical protein